LGNDTPQQHDARHPKDAFSGFSFTPLARR
jgi:hypothetical protein